LFLFVYFNLKIWQSLCDRAFPFTTPHGKGVKVIQVCGETQNRKKCNALTLMLTDSQTKETVMNHKTNQPTSSKQGKAQNLSAQSDIGQSDTKEIIFLASGLIILTLGLGGLFMYSADEPLPATASQKSAEAVSALQMAKAFVPPTPSSTIPISGEERPVLAEDSSLHLITHSPEIREANDTDVYFEFNRWALSDEAKDLIKTKVEAQGGEWTGTLHIDGHTDAQGTDSYNRTLGLKRAESVKTYLVSLGIPEDRIQVKSFGKDGAVCQDQTPDCFEHNRRAHVAFLAQPTVQQDETLLSMTPHPLEDSTHEESAPMIAHQAIEESEGEIPVQEEIPGELVAVDPASTTESLP
jgi:peptidoglycan-associated lipoprotein